MSMTPFYTRLPELAARETRCVHSLQPNGRLPLGEYGFVELYCDEDGCDCRRVLVQVTTPAAPQTALATINYGWESAAFYTHWMHGDEQAGREITAATLDPLHPQSEHADYLLDIFREIVRTDPAYVARLARHYELFKNAPGHQRGSSKLPDVVQDSLPPRLDIAEILRQLQRVPDQADFAPYEAALRAALKQRDGITPELIAAIERVAVDPARYLKDREDCLHLFAIYLLANFRETRALDCFLRFFSIPGETALDLTGDMVTEHGAVVLASVCGGDPAPLLKLIHDEAVNEFVRTEATAALLVQALWGERPREAVVEDLRRLFNSLARPGNAYVWAGLTGAVCDFHATELAREARQAFADGLVDESVLNLDGLEGSLFGHRRELDLQHFRERNQPIDVVNECSAWLCFREEEQDGPGTDDDDMDREAHPDDAFDLPANALLNVSKPQPYFAEPKVGRNDPCPCGSGKKCKKCCGK